ncbi:MAG: GDSL-type esterase/lipase family protein [Acidobacteriaceae bacterium]
MRLSQHIARKFVLIALLPLACIAQAPVVAPAAPAQTAPVLAAPSAEGAVSTAPRSTIASDSNSRSHPVGYKNCNDRIAAAKGHPVDILFVGDSITESWTSAPWGGVNRGAAIWDKMYAPRNALNFGAGADRTQHVLWRLDTMDVKDLKPKVTVVMIGTNNNIDTAPDIAAGVKAVITKLETMYPMTKIILVSILPSARAAELMAQANEILKTFADDQTVYYLDLAAKMPPVGDSWLGLGPDKLHPTDVGYQIWADTMEPLLTKLLGTGQP